ncbi:cytochrome P450 [Lentibacillus kapialis]|uniref:Cytochrome P450 n=1 Tax=Lentibacillus kapialis TaxID=340214 RepID=A0A917PRS0_9BACI|nr:cytochrome P450 [Lentibacillus kapialis]GGJ88750.1 cytochrome P450 [Lentibacillus kapialis]
MAIPREQGLDHTHDLVSEGFFYIPNRRRKFQSDIFHTRLFGQKVVCMGGEKATEVFYDETKFKRKGAAPSRIKESLFGKGGVQGLDGSAHKHRKHLFMSLMTSEYLNELRAITRKQWRIAIDNWKEKRELSLLHESEKLMCRIACEWADVPLFASELNQRARDLAAMIDAFGAVGPRHWKGRMARNRSEKWVRRLIRQVRSGDRHPREGTALYEIAWHRNLNGKLLSLQIAAVELLNVLRPITAIGRYVTFGALAMHDFPETKAKLQTRNDKDKRMFAQEVRRYYPFAPFLGARVRYNFKWGGCHFRKGTLVLLDIYGTNHDPEIWDNPDMFRPERFEEWDGSPFNFIPQGGGDYSMGHRCAGEWITIDVMKISLEFLANKIDYQLPTQNLDYSMIRIPPLPKSRLMINQVTNK